MQIYNLGNPSNPYKTMESPLKWQTRCVTVFPDHTGFLVGSIEGRVAVQHVEDNMQTKNFTFKCHRCACTCAWPGKLHVHLQLATVQKCLQANAACTGMYACWYALSPGKENSGRAKDLCLLPAWLTAAALTWLGSVDVIVGCRDGNDVYAVNSIRFHPQFGTFVTAGSDGAYNFWVRSSMLSLGLLCAGTCIIHFLPVKPHGQATYTFAD